MHGTGWFAAPNFIFDIPALTAAQRLLYLYLCRRAGPDGTSWPGIQRIAKDLGVSRNTVRDGIAALVAAGILDRQPRRGEDGATLSHKYTIITQAQPPVSRGQSEAGEGLKESGRRGQYSAGGGVNTSPRRTTHIKDDTVEGSKDNIVAFPVQHQTAKPDPRPTMNDVKDFHAHYCERWTTVFPRGPRLLPGRIKKIAARLQTFSVKELKQACDNLYDSAWHRGENPQRKPYGTLDFLVRSDEQVDRWLNVGRPAPVSELTSRAVIEQARRDYEEAQQLWSRFNKQ